MAFDIILQTNNSENNCITKDVTTITTLSGTLRNESSIIDPVILIESDISTLTGCNYLSIPTFGRSYFVNNITSVRNNLVRLECHVDVLSSFATEIKSNSGVVRRQEKPNAYNLMINDGSLVAYQDPYILTKAFPSGFTSTGLILIVAG